ncbi:MAG: AAA family ATPase [Desulfurellaceae bacterium]|nr:AAA family ATPase [Desulfurellaceae bacterium]
MQQLKSIRIAGFRSIKDMKLALRPLNILIGANGAGKSNLIAFFKLLNELMAGRLRQYIGETGRASANLHFGPKITPQLEAEMAFEVDNGTATYRIRLAHAAGDTLIFAEEMLFFYQIGSSDPKVIVSTGVGHQESRIGNEPAEKEEKTLKHLLNRCRVYHFHDTSPTSRVRQYCYIGDNRWLMPDAANLAAVLYKLKSHKEAVRRRIVGTGRVVPSSENAVYRRIVETVRQVAPFFDDFDLETTDSHDIILNWRHRGSDRVFGPHQLSDGTLRAICLIALLLQPKEDLPILIVVDEPELGLHPYALNVIASLLREASCHTQVLVSTQSSTFLDSFEPEDIIVVERNNEATEFHRQDAKRLDAWLEDYSLGEVWQKNVIGGGPH